MCCGRLGTWALVSSTASAGSLLRSHEVTERRSHGAPCFFVRDTRAVCCFHEHHHGDDRISLWCPIPLGVADALVSAEPERFLKPPTSAAGTFSRWWGMYLDASGRNAVDWNEVAAVLEDAYRTVAPKMLVAKLDDR